MENDRKWSIDEIIVQEQCNIMHTQVDIMRGAITLLGTYKTESVNKGLTATKEMTINAEIIRSAEYAAKIIDNYANVLLAVAKNYKQLDENLGNNLDAK